MKIAFIIPHAGLAGGIRVAAEYARKLKQRGHTATVVSAPLPVPPVREKIKSRLRGAGWPKKHRDATDHGYLLCRHRV